MGAVLVGSSGFDARLTAAAGASFLRVGFEDSRDYGDSTAKSNVELVSALRQELEVSGFTAVSVEKRETS